MMSPPTSVMEGRNAPTLRSSIGELPVCLIAAIMPRPRCPKALWVLTPREQACVSTWRAGMWRAHSRRLLPTPVTFDCSGATKL